MNKFEKAAYERSLLMRMNNTLKNAGGRLHFLSPDDEPFTPSSVEGINDLSTSLLYYGGLTQQERMIRDKRKSFDRAVKYSYQGAIIQRPFDPDEELMEDDDRLLPARALINPNKLKQDYDDKILSVGYEHNYKPGDVFKWVGTDTYWLIYLQDLTELAYFRGDIRKCEYQIKWNDEDGLHKTFATVRGPVETRIDYLQKYGNSYDNPNYSLEIMIPKNESTLKYFVRYARFYLSDGVHNTCWRIEGVDAFSMDGIIQFTAVEYYSNIDTDDIAQGIPDSMVNTLSTEDNAAKGMLLFAAAPPQMPTIDGEGFIRPKCEYVYTLLTDDEGMWVVDSKKYPVDYIPFINEKGMKSVKIKWKSNYSGQFDLIFKTVAGKEYNKTVVAESLY